MLSNQTKIVFLRCVPVTPKHSAPCSPPQNHTISTHATNTHPKPKQPLTTLLSSLQHFQPQRTQTIAFQDAFLNPSINKKKLRFHTLHTTIGFTSSNEQKKKSNPSSQEYPHFHQITQLQQSINQSNQPTIQGSPTCRASSNSREPHSSLCHQSLITLLLPHQESPALRH